MMVNEKLVKNLLKKTAWKEESEVRILGHN